MNGRYDTQKLLDGIGIQLRIRNQAISNFGVPNQELHSARKRVPSRFIPGHHQCDQHHHEFIGGEFLRGG